jgi:hypothetical protein
MSDLSLFLSFFFFFGEEFNLIGHFCVQTIKVLTAMETIYRKLRAGQFFQFVNNVGVEH